MKNPLVSIYHRAIHKMISPFQEKFNKWYLQLSDCDGMCHHCHPSLKSKCSLAKEMSHEATNYEYQLVEERTNS